MKLISGYCPRGGDQSPRAPRPCQLRPHPGHEAFTHRLALAQGRVWEEQGLEEEEEPLAGNLLPPSPFPTKISELVLKGNKVPECCDSK